MLAAVVGSGIMAAKLAGGNAALALLCNTLPTGAILTVLILIFGPISGAHFNPAVSIAFALRGELSGNALPPYIAGQIIGGRSGGLTGARLQRPPVPRQQFVEPVDRVLGETSQHIGQPKLADPRRSFCRCCNQRFGAAPDGPYFLMASLAFQTCRHYIVYRRTSI